MRALGPGDGSISAPARLHFHERRLVIVESAVHPVCTDNLCDETPLRDPKDPLSLASARARARAHTL